MMKIRRIGLVYESREDAIACKISMDKLYHWREETEIAALTDSLQALGFEPILLGNPAKLVTQSQWMKEIDFILNLSVGFSSRNRLALAPSLYQLSGIPYSGGDPCAKLLSQNKPWFKAMLNKLGIPTPEWLLLQTMNDIPDALKIGFPAMVKPAYEGSSIGIYEDSIASNPQQLARLCSRIIDQLGMPVLVERFVTGREYKVGFIGNQVLKAACMLEDVCENGAPMGDKFLHFDVKTKGLFKKKAMNIEEKRFEKLYGDCRRVYDLFLPVDYGTFDIRVDENGRHYFVEFNADATLHPDRTLSQCCILNGISYTHMVQRILEASFERQGMVR